MKTTAFSTSLDSKPLPPLEKGVAAKLDKPLVIPRGLEQPRTIRLGSRWGKPFVRAYSPTLEAHGITKEGFLEFLDELNMKKRGNPIWQDIISIGDSLKQAGKVDPTHIVKLVGAIILLLGKIGAWNSGCGAFSLRAAFLRKANRELFGPKGLKASFMSAKQLRKHRGIAPNADLALPLEHRHIRAVPTQEELIKASALSSDPHTARFLRSTAGGRKWAGKGILDWQLYTELNMEFSRGKAIKRREEALAEPTEAKKKKGLKAARKIGVEVKMANRNRWLVIEQA
ncbi:hypothetical protein B0H11DRAFT_2241805 [Mycena galericulata]|nr:hypothetical protein B0H11DRAFT_2241805 [Mycena galericulata]